MSHERSEELAKELSKSGAKFAPFSRSPIEGASAVLNRDGNERVNIWAEEKANIETSIDKSHRQAIVTIDDPVRTLTTTDSFSIGRMGRNKEAFETEIRRVIEPQRLKDNHENPFADYQGLISSSTKTTKPLEEILKDSRKIKNNQHLEIEITHKAKLRSTHQSFLTGIDEVAHFVCVLPEVVKTVTEAHELLRPKNVPEGSLRQGEFFFVPAEKEVEKILKNQKVQPFVRTALEPQSTHSADVVLRFRNKLYVMGGIRDDRKGRHEVLVLNTWHRVVRNTEVVQRENTRYYD